MQQRSAAFVIIVGFLTLYIYTLIWMYKTKNEMNALGANIPSFIFAFIPFVNFWWMWKWSQGVEIVSRNKMTAAVAFILLWLLGPIGGGIIQSTFNGMATESAAV